MLSHQDLRLLRYFVEVVRAGSIRAAAHQLRLTPAVISEALTKLETDLGVTLLRRTTRSMRLTPIGDDVFHRAADMVSAGEDALRVGRSTATVPSGPLNITISGELCLSWFPEKLKSFEDSNPDVQITVAVEDTSVTLAQSEFDLAIRAEFIHEPDLQGQDGIYIPLECVCAGHLVKKRETLKQRLSRIGLIGRTSPNVAHRSIWVAHTAKKKLDWSEMSVPCRFHALEHVVSHRLALEGFGAALLMRPTVANDLKQQRLVRVSPSHSFGFAAVSVRYRDKHPTAAADAMYKHLGGTDL